jgi:AraC-like DNA-binding protein
MNTADDRSALLQFRWCTALDWKNAMFRSNRLLVRLTISFLVTGFALTGLLLVLANALVSRIISAEKSQAATEQLEQAYNTSYYALTDVYGDFYTLWAKDPDILAALAASSLTAEQMARAGDALDAAVFRDVLVHSACLVNEDAGQVISNLAGPSGLADYFDSGAIQLFHDFEANYATAKNEVFFPRSATLALNGQTEKRNYISLIFAQLADDGKLHAGLIVNIDQAQLSALVNIDSANGQMMIVNRSGKIISDRSGSSFAGDFPNQNLLASILGGTAENGSLTGDYGGENSFITYKKASTLGFAFLNVLPYDQLMLPVQQTNRIMVLLFGLAILLSLAISIVSAQKIYQPINRLIRGLQSVPSIKTDSGQDEYAYLTAAFSSLVAQNEQANLVQLLQGNFTARTLESLKFGHRSFLPVALVADNPAAASDEWLARVSQIVQRDLRLPAALMPGPCVSLVFNAETFDETEMDWIVSQVAALQQSIAAATGETASAGVGSAVDAAAGLKASQLNALAAAQYAAGLGAGQLIPFSEIQNHPLSANQNRSAVAETVDAYIQAHYARPGFSLEEIAEHVGLSVGYMRQIFKLERGVPVNDYIISFRIRKASELLAGTDMTAKDIAESVGYLDSRYFYTLFKKKVGLTTDEYRRFSKAGGAK